MHKCEASWSIWTKVYTTVISVPPTSNITPTSDLKDYDSYEQQDSSPCFHQPVRLPVDIIILCKYEQCQPKTLHGQCCPYRYGKASSTIDLWRKIRIAICNVRTLQNIGYKVAVVCELARLKLNVSGITEAWIPGSNCHPIEDAIMLHSGTSKLMVLLRLWDIP